MKTLWVEADKLWPVNKGRNGRCHHARAEWVRRFDWAMFGKRLVLILETIAGQLAALRFSAVSGAAGATMALGAGPEGRRH